MEPINSLGRRKTSVARVVLTEGDGSFTVNGRDGKEYFPITMQQFKLQQPFKLTETVGKYDVTVNVNGGGITGQVDAVRLGIARALVKADPELKPKLKAEELMTRDPAVTERKKVRTQEGAQALPVQQALISHACSGSPAVRWFSIQFLRTRNPGYRVECLQNGKKESEPIIKTQEWPVLNSSTLLEAGVHFGHLRRKWNPNMAPTSSPRRRASTSST
jgi:small subunit ribosomal protein S9